jgi:phospholipase/lecithinase/hemolysin
VVKSRLLLIAVVLFSAVGGRAEATIAHLQNLLVFGDSLTDTGNSRILTQDHGQTNPLPIGYPVFWPPQPPYAMGRSSNGPLAPEYL